MKYAIISDIHEDILSLEKVFEHIQMSDVDKIVCLGDITGFSDLHHFHDDSKDADACINLIRKHCDIAVPGNHDLYTIGKLPAYLKRHEEANSFLDIETWEYKDELNPLLNIDNVDYLSGLSEYFIEEFDTYKVLFSHFIFPDLSGSSIIIPEIRKELKPHFNFMNRHDCTLSFVGHTHIDGFALSKGRNVKFKEFGYRKISRKQQIVFVPALVKSVESSGYLIFDAETFELFAIKTNS